MTEKTATHKANKIELKPLTNRELSWLAFNDRVIEEAQDVRYPLLERLKFVSIVSSNLDEFFMIRVAGLERKVKLRPHAKEDNGQQTIDVLYQIREWALEQKGDQGLVLRDLLEKLKAKQLYMQTQISPTDSALLDHVKKLQPHLKIQHFADLSQLNLLDGSRLYVFVRFKTKFAIISLADTADRLVRLPGDVSQVTHHFVLAEKLIVAGAQHLFPDEPVLEAFPFKLIRDADVIIDPNTDPEELLTTVEEAILARGRLTVVRLEVDAPHISDGALLLANAYKLNARALYRYDAPLDLKVLWRLYDIEGFESLRFPKSKAATVTQRVPDLVQIIRGHDILLHHPYDSFDTVVHLLQAAAIDPHVTEVRQTLYRTGRQSPIVEALIQAAKNGKKVTVAVELRARFDEASNIELAKELKKYGVVILKGFSDKKIHCKLTQIIRKEGDKETSFVHIGTGNYNSNTARLYTDLSLLTIDPVIGRDAEKIFKAIQIGIIPRKFESFVAAPVQLHDQLSQWIQNEIRRAKLGAPAHIIAKMNALVDIKLVEALYRASQAGVKVDLIVRGACILRPGIPGLSDNIRVISIVDRYLEHSRIYFFQNGGNPHIYLSSADWMPRNLHNRIEVAFPINDPELKKYIRDVILETFLKDNQKARMLLPDSNWVRVQPSPGEPPHQAQEVFQRLAKSNYKNTPLESRFVLQKDDALNIPPLPEVAKGELVK
ncbi:MAG: polyphosphate kinase 1 [Oligoflexia bacterium]|nr:polyphosphate kinase 1 [Oligoflexia bacterium]